MLAQQGLVEHLPRRGMRVTEMSRRLTSTNSSSIRQALERYAIEAPFRWLPLTTTGWTSRDRRLDEMRQADADGDELRKDDAHRAFHAAVVGLAGNRQLDLALEPILLKLQRPMAVNLRREAQLVGPAEGIRRHERLLPALESNDRQRSLTSSTRTAVALPRPPAQAMSPGRLL